VPHKPKNPNFKPTGSKQKRRHKTNRQNNLWKWTGLGIAAIVIIVAVILRISTINGIPHISVTDAYQKYQQGAFFLDVRSQAEFDQSYILNSTLIPLDELQNRLSGLPKDRDIVVVCLSGHRSEQGVTILKDAGFPRASCMTGGLTAWKAAGYPLEGSSP
jgi:rhodanese-related sulfurtransferase